MKKQRLNLKYRSPYADPLNTTITHNGPKSTPADPNSVSTLKKQYKRFWKQRIFNADEALKLEYWTQFYEKHPVSNSAFFQKIRIKLWLENKITDEQSNNIKAMLDSPDGENAIMAIALMMQLGGRRMCGKKKQQEPV